MLFLLKKLAAVAIALLLFTTVAFASDNDNRMREVGDEVYSFTIGEGNHSMDYKNPQFRAHCEYLFSINVV